MNEDLLAAIGLLIFGLLSSIGAVAVFLQTRKKLRHSRRARATVIGFEEDETYCEDTGEYITVYYPVIRFKNSQGLMVECGSDTTRSPEMLHRTIAVRYVHKDGKYMAYERSVFQDILIPLFFALAGVFGILAGVGLLLANSLG